MSTYGVEDHMKATRTLLFLLLVAVLGVGLVGCSASGEISDEGINAEVEGEEGDG